MKKNIFFLFHATTAGAILMASGCGGGSGSDGSGSSDSDSDCIEEVARVVGKGGQGTVWMYPSRPKLVFKTCTSTEFHELAAHRYVMAVGGAAFSVSPPVHRVDVTDKYVALVMDKGATTCLAGARDLDVLRTLLAQVCILDAWGIHHCDLKPQNVVRAPEGGCWVIDFGSVSTRCHELAGLFRTGTYGFMPPEAVLSMDACPDAHKVDVWALGIVVLAQFVDLKTLGNDAFFDPSRDCSYSHVVALFQFFGTPRVGHSSLCDMAGFEGAHKWPAWPKQRKLSDDKRVAERVTDAELLDLLDHMLVLDPKRRYGFQDIVNHAFMAKVRPVVQAGTAAGQEWALCRQVDIASPMLVGIPHEATVAFRSMSRVQAFIPYLPVAMTMFVSWMRHGVKCSCTWPQVAHLLAASAALGFGDTDIAVAIAGRGGMGGAALRRLLLTMVSEAGDQALSLNPVAVAVSCAACSVLRTLDAHLRKALVLLPCFDAHRMALAVASAKARSVGAQQDPYATDLHVTALPLHTLWATNAVVEVLLCDMEAGACSIPLPDVLFGRALGVAQCQVSPCVGLPAGTCLCFHAAARTQ